MVSTFFKWSFYSLIALLWIVALTWCSLAISIDGAQGSLGKVLLGLFLISQVIALFVIKPRKLGFLVSFLLFSSICAWWLSIKASNDRNWMRDVAKLPRAVFDGDKVTIYNVRDFEYKSETEYTERWETRTYDLSKIKGFDVYLSYWGPKWMAHAISSWEFEDGENLAISIETRKEVGESYSALLGFFRQFELYYVVADERDVIKLRTNYRGEQVYLYRTKDSPETARKLLVDYLKEINNLGEHPRWYNALTKNCSTAIRDQRSHIMTLPSWNWKMLANGYMDELAYSRGQIDTTLPFDQYKKSCFVNDKAHKARADEDFSRAIRRAE